MTPPQYYGSCKDNVLYFGTDKQKVEEVTHQRAAQISNYAVERLEYYEKLFNQEHIDVDEENEWMTST